MTRIVNLKEHIFDTAKNLALTNGISHVNVRLVAKESGIALGTIYNYYPAKGDIIADIIEDFWQAAFSGIDFRQLQQMDCLDCLEYIYYRLQDYLDSFRENWLEQLSLLNVNDKTIGRTKEKEYFKKISNIILSYLERSDGVSSELTYDELVKLSEFIFDNMLLMLKRGDHDFSFFKKVIGKILLQ